VREERDNSSSLELGGGEKFMFVLQIRRGWEGGRGRGIGPCVRSDRRIAIIVLFWCPGFGAKISHIPKV
jgi:hypothetical protein